MYKTATCRLTDRKVGQVQIQSNQFYLKLNLYNGYWQTGIAPTFDPAKEIFL